MFGIYRKKVNFLFIFSVKGNNLTFFLVNSRLFFLAQNV